MAGVLPILGGIVTAAAKLAEYLVTPIGREFGYLCSFDKNLENLQEQNEQLENIRVGVQLLVEGARRNVEVIGPDVEAWLTKVENTKIESEKIFERKTKVGTGCFSGWCQHLKSRYSLSKRAKKMTRIASELQGRGKFERVSYPASITTSVASASTGDFRCFESRNLVMKEIIEALQIDEISMIGICGMGGIGKTILVEEVARRAKLEHVFDEVALAVVSHDPDFMKIQGQLADMLGVRFVEESIPGRADRLYTRLMNGSRILVILDDVWEEIDLRKIGIPFGGDRKGCKIVLTSRVERVCAVMGTQRNFIIEVLSKEEAWDFFKEMVGNTMDYSNLHVTAKEVAKECGGLPLAIKTVAHALQSKRKHAWDDALAQLRKSTVTNIIGMHKKVYSSIELSYNYLESEQAKSLLMLCCLFPEDYDIPVELLVRYGKGLFLFSDIESLLETRNRVSSLIDELRSCFLLLAGNERSVKMHDVVRDVVISIASSIGHFKLGHDDGLKEWPFVREDKSYTAISLNSNELDKLPADLNCPNLQLFQLQCMMSSGDMPDDLFKGMKELRVIGLEGLFLHLLPSSLCLLSNIRTLCLDDCNLKTKLNILGRLDQLEVLSFFGSRLDELPGEIRELRKLNLLDLRSREGPRIFPSGVLLELSKLEELYIGGNFWYWEEAGYDGNASLKELNSLPSLRTLQICVSSCDIMSKLTDFPFEKLTRFNISVGVLAYSGSYDFDNSLTLHPNTSYFPESRMSVLTKTTIMTLLKRSVYLNLECEGWIRNPLYELGEEDFLNLRNLTLYHSTESYLINLNSWTENYYGNISSSSLMTNSLWRGPIQLAWLGNLCFLKLWWCNSVKVLFPRCVVVCMVQLQELIIQFCQKMEQIVANEGEQNEDDRVAETIEFPKLAYLSLSGMPAFRSFYSECGTDESAYDHEATGRDAMLNHHVFLPSLEVVEVYKMKNLIQVVGGKTLACSVHKVREMWVHKCKNMLVVAASDLGSLQKLKVESCKSLQAVFIFKGNQMKLSQLNSLELENLPKLVEIWSIPPGGNQTFQNLRSLRAKNCNNLRFLLPFHVAKMLVKIQVMKIKQCETMEGVIETERENVDDAELTLFPDLESLVLKDLPILERFASGSYISKWPALRKLKVAACPKWRAFHLAPLDGRKRRIEDTEPMEALQPSNLKTYTGSLFHEKLELPSLEKLHISGKVEMIADGKHQSGTSNKLREMHIKECDVLLYAICISSALHWRNLEKLVVYECVTLINVFHIQGTGVGDESEATNSESQSNIAVQPGHQLLMDSPLCNLKVLNVVRCKKLLNIFPSLYLPLLMNLEVLYISNCTSLIEVIPLDVPKLLCFKDGVSFFRSLTKLVVYQCENVRYLLSPSIARGLMSIQTLEICDCKLIEQIVGEEENEEKINKLVLPQLEKLELRKLENLRWFFCGDLEFPSLVDFMFYECPRMEGLCSGSVRTPKIFEVKLGYFKTIWAWNLNSTIRSLNRSQAALKNEAQSSRTLVEKATVYEFEEPAEMDNPPAWSPTY